MKINIGDYEVLADGTIVSLPNEPIKFNIQDLIFELHFVDDLISKAHNVKAESIDGKKGIRLIFTNFNNNLGTGNTVPLQLGTLGTKKLFFNYRIYSLQIGTGKTVHYTWLTKES